MLALSTAYFTLRDADPPGDEIAGGALALGFRALELDYRVTADGHCASCGTAIAGRFEAWQGQFGRRRIPVRAAARFVAS